MADPTERPVLTTTEAGKILGLGDEAVKRYLQAGRLEGFKLPGGHYRVFADSVEKLMRPAAQ